jgi:hypothetical protein
MASPFIRGLVPGCGAVRGRPVDGLAMRAARASTEASSCGAAPRLRPRCLFPRKRRVLACGGRTRGRTGCPPRNRSSDAPVAGADVGPSSLSHAEEVPRTRQSRLHADAERIVPETTASLRRTARRRRARSISNTGLLKSTVATVLLPIRIAFLSVKTTSQKEPGPVLKATIARVPCEFRLLPVDQDLPF